MEAHSVLVQGENNSLLGARNEATHHHAMMATHPSLLAKLLSTLASPSSPSSITNIITHWT
jgi:hypothetical protein